MSFLIKKKGAKAAHLWDHLDADTVCTMYSTSSMNRNPHRYEVVEQKPDDLEVCHMCQVNALKQPEWMRHL